MNGRNAIANNHAIVAAADRRWRRMTVPEIPNQTRPRIDQKSA
jgi:hypothetical protein